MVDPQLQVSDQFRQVLFEGKGDRLVQRLFKELKKMRAEFADCISR
jgi:hypothetical protein